MLAFGYMNWLLYHKLFYYQVHVSGAGDYQLSKIEILKDPFPLNARKDLDVMDSDDFSDEVLVFCLYIAKKTIWGHIFC